MPFGLSLTFKTKGVGEIYSALRAADKKLARQTMRKAITEANRLVLRDAKSHVPEQTKTLKKALGSKVKSYRGGLVIVGMVGPRKDARGKPAKFRRTVKVTTRHGPRQEIRNPVKYAHLVELGTRPHALGKGSMLRRVGKKHGKQKQHGLMHPGAKPKPFLKPALSTNRQAIQAILIRHLQGAMNGLGKK